MKKAPKKVKKDDTVYPSFTSSKEEQDNKHIVESILKRLRMLENRKGAMRVVQE
jgi:hypothetical protein